ncbi:MAG: hypothetical protein RBS34_00315 [Desulfofustis sp.]|jgi:hypothetical protein|nr:hypothetical protein [Desulfofustis sp.]
MAQRFSTGLIASMLCTGSFQDVMANGVLRFFTGAQPATADDAETGTLLLQVTISSGAFTPGAATNGLNFDDTTTTIITKEPAEIWSGVGLADGTAGWFRFYDNTRTTGASTTAKRFDGSCATSGGQATMASTSIVTGATTTVSSCTVTLPKQA